MLTARPPTPPQLISTPSFAFRTNVTSKNHKRLPSIKNRIHQAASQLNTGMCLCEHTSDWHEFNGSFTNEFTSSWLEFAARVRGTSSRHEFVARVRGTSSWHEFAARVRVQRRSFARWTWSWNFCQFSSSRELLQSLALYSRLSPHGQEPAAPRRIA